MQTLLTRFNRHIPWVVTFVALIALVGPPLYSQTQVANAPADLAGKILMVADSATGRTVTNLFTFNRGAAVPFAVDAASLKVTNLDADKLDGQTGTFYNDAANLTGVINASLITTGTLPVARLAAGTFTVVTSTTTSNQNNWAPGLVGNTVIYWSGASDITVTGFAGGVTGQIIVFKDTGTAVTTFSHNSGSSSAGNKLFNTVTSAGTPVAGKGYIIYQFDGTQWQLVDHEQGAWITTAFNAVNYLGVGGTWTVAVGDVSCSKYRLSGNTISVNFSLGSTSTGAGTITQLVIAKAAYGGFDGAAVLQVGSANAQDNGAGLTGAYAQFGVSESGGLRLIRHSTAAWTASVTDNTGVYGQVNFEVT